MVTRFLIYHGRPVSHISEHVFNENSLTMLRSGERLLTKNFLSSMSDVKEEGKTVYSDAG